MKIKKMCNIQGCENTARSKGLCEKHYRRYRLDNASTCSEPGCDKPSVAGGLCRKHYQQKYRKARTDG